MRRVLVLSLVAVSLSVPLGCAKKQASVPLADAPPSQAPEREVELQLQPQRLHLRHPALPVEQPESDERQDSNPRPAK
jgi:hypothetical protein